MSGTLERPLTSAQLADWVRRTDEHAPRHLELLARAERVLSRQEPADAAQRQQLASRLERWRYQRLNRCGGAIGREERALLDALDLAALRLVGYALRDARWPRGALVSDNPDFAPDAEILRRLAAPETWPELAERARAATEANFSAGPGAGRRMLLYAPLYLSNYCVNHCTYCGFRHPNPIRRRRLEVAEALAEAEVLRRRGHRHILLVAGDYPSLVPLEYYRQIIAELTARGIAVAVEIAPQETAAYAELAAAGACGVTLYQETYDEPAYAGYHPRGSKASFDWRLEGLERAADAGIRRLGLGVLLGLGEPRAELAALLRHAAYLTRRYGDCTLAFSLPRIHEAPAGFRAPHPVDDELFVALYCALRLAFPRAELVLSTRESPGLRNRLADVCITQLSAGSCTAPGGYEEAPAAESAGEQFPVCDRRPTAEVASWLGELGFAVTWSVPSTTKAQRHEGDCAT